MSHLARSTREPRELAPYYYDVGPVRVKALRIVGRIVRRERRRFWREPRYFVAAAGLDRWYWERELEPGG